MSKTSCPICNKEVSYTGFHKHIFSELHTNHLYGLVFQRKEAIQKYIDGKHHNLMTWVVPDKKKITTTLKLCFGCNTAYCSKSYSVEHSCNKQAENIEFLKKILTTYIPPKPVVDLTEVERLTRKMIQLEANIKTSEKNYDEEVEKTGNMCCLMTAMMKKWKAGVPYNDMMIQLEDEYSEIYDNVMLELNTVEGEEL